MLRFLAICAVVLGRISERQSRHALSAPSDGQGECVVGVDDAAVEPMTHFDCYPHLMLRCRFTRRSWGMTR